MGGIPARPHHTERRTAAGTIREDAGSQRDPVTFTTAGYRPMFVRAVDDCIVWLHGPATRVEYDGDPVFITDGTTAWDFTPDPQRPLVGPTDRVHYFGKNQFLIRRRSAAEWAGDDFTRPTGPITEETFLDRRCWTVELAPPERKPHPMRIWVDIETGRILGYRVDAVGVGAHYVDLAVGEPIDSSMFAWSGPTQTQQERQDELRRRSDDMKRASGAVVCGHRDRRAAHRARPRRLHPHHRAGCGRSDRRIRGAQRAHHARPEPTVPRRELGTQMGPTALRVVHTRLGLGGRDERGRHRRRHRARVAEHPPPGRPRRPPATHRSTPPRPSRLILLISPYELPFALSGPTDLPSSAFRGTSISRS